jgi:Mg2+-importing ATPase
MVSVVGLTEKEVKELQKKHGKNEISTSEGSFWKIVKSNFINPLSILLYGVGAVTYLLDDQISATIILVVVILNGALGVYQEYKSEKASEKLKKQISYKAKVYRDLNWTLVNISELVPGDYVRFELGDRMPADIAIDKADELLIDESTITGESYPVRKNTVGKTIDQKSTALMGTIISSGSGEGRVINIGKNTAFGKTSLLLSETDSQSTFEKNVSLMSNSLVKVIIVSTLLVFVLNAIIGKGIVASLLFAVALAIGLAPEALPVIITITLSGGAFSLSKHGVIVKRLSSVEDLGNVDILCTDKTGTLTENSIRVDSYINTEGQADEKIIEYATVCVWAAHSNPIDDALMENKAKNTKELKKWEVISRVQFDFERRRMSVLAQKNNKKIIICKGSPEAIILISNMSKAEQTQATKKYRELGENGLRAIAVAIKEVDKQQITKEDERDLQFAGFVTFADPPKKEVRQTLEIARRLGISIKLLSGDNSSIAKSVAKQVGFDFSEDQVVSGDELEKIYKDKVKFEEKIQKAVIFSRVSPAQKHAIVRCLRSMNHCVAFMGDGINDAPAIKEADVGISVNNATDVAKEAADIILVKKSLNAVIQGISGGRKVFSNIIKYIFNTLAGNFGNIFTVGFGSIFIPFIPLTPVQIILANFLTDGPMVAISTDNVDDEELVKPKKWDIDGIVRIGGIFGLISTIFDLITIIYFLHLGEAVFRTALFLEVFLSEVIILISLRSARPFFKSEPLSLPLFISTVLVVIIAFGLVYSNIGLYFGFEQLSISQMGVLIAIVIGYLLTTEIVKNVYYNVFRKVAIADKETLKLMRKKISPDLH